MYTRSVFRIAMRSRVTTGTALSLGMSAWLTLTAGAAAQEPPEIIWQIPAHGGGVETVAFSHDGTRVASGSSGASPEAQARNASDGGLIVTLPGQANGVRAVDFSPTDELLAVGGIVPNPEYPINFGETDVWNLTSESIVHTFAGGYAAFAATGSRLASGGLGNDRNVRVHTLPAETELINANTGSNVFALDLSPDGSIAASTEYGGRIDLWNVNSGRFIRSLDHPDRPGTIAFSPDGEMLASGNFAFDADSTIKLWRVSDGQLLRTITGYDAYINDVEFSPDGQTLVSASANTSLEPRIRFWNVPDAAPLTSLSPGAGAVKAVVFSHDGGRILYGCADGSVTVAHNPLASGCPDTTDGDGVCDADDACPNTIPGIMVDGSGCPPEVPGDSEPDGDVDSSDVDAFIACLSGPAIPVTPSCQFSDIDEDNDVDLTDFAFVQRCHSGENIPADLQCAD